MGWATLWVTFSKTHLVTLHESDLRQTLCFFMHKASSQQQQQQQQ
jgi:hypothetical protein